jgi:3-dehydroquinate synthetase
MVDASIGGKTGVDHERGKNVIGAFVQPRVIVMDPETLASLPERELRAGWAEFIKHGFILDPKLIEHVETLELTRAALSDPRIVGWSAGIKARVVSGDEREEGQRTLLNYGHTFGHAIEAVTGYSTYLHGEAVAIGMRAAGLISVAMGMLSAAEFERQQRLIRKVGLPETAPGVSIDAVLAATLGDKKVSGGRIKWVLLNRLGEATTRSDVAAEVVRDAALAILPE